MRKLTLLMHISLDGYVAGPNGSLDWVHMDDELFRDAADLAAEADTALYGRITYQMMESYWPTVLANRESTDIERRHAAWMEQVHKIVFSTTLKEVCWNNTRLINDNIPEEIHKLKRQRGRNMMVFGSPVLTHSLLQMGLIDEFRLNISPVAIGNGIPLFRDLDRNMELKLVRQRLFKSGVAGMHYEMIRK